MKAIIDGKLYDTETATELTRWRPPDYGDGEFTIVLYRTAKGAHFKDVVEEEPFNSHKIIPLSDDQIVNDVLSWGGGVDEVLRLFPDRIEVA